MTEHIESLLTMMDFRGRWEPIDRFIKLGGIQLMLQVISLFVPFFAASATPMLGLQEEDDRLGSCAA